MKLYQHNRLRMKEPSTLQSHYFPLSRIPYEHLSRNVEWQLEIYDVWTKKLWKIIQQYDFTGKVQEWKNH